MSEKVKGITIVLDGDSTPLKNAIKGLNKETNDLQRELRGVETLLKMDPGNVDLLKQKQDLLSQSVEGTKDKLEALRSAKAKIDDEMSKGTEYNEEQYRNLQREIVFTEQSLGKMEEKLKGIGSTSGEAEKIKHAISDISKESEGLQNELGKVNNLLKLDPSNTELIAQKQKILGNEVGNTKEKLDLLKESQSLLSEEFGKGEIGEEAYREVAREIVETEKSLESMQKELELVNDKWTESARRLDDFGNKAVDVGKNLTTKVTVPIAAVGGAGVKMGIDLDTALVKLSTLADLDEVPLEKLKEEIMKLSNETGIAVSKLTEDVYNAISAGQKTGDAVAFVAESAKLAKAGFADSSQALDLLTTTLNAYKMESEEAGRVSDLLITTQNEGKVTLDELASSMGKLIPTAVETNTELEQLTTAYAVMTKNGIGASEATTYLNGMMNELSKDGSKAQIALQEVAGKGFGDLMSEGNNLTDVLVMLDEHAKANGLSLKDLFGSAEAGKAALSLSSEGGREFVEILEEMQNSLGTTDKAVQDIDESVGVRATNSFNKFKNVLIELTDVFLPLINIATTLLGGIATVLSALPAPLQAVIGTLLAMIAAVGPLIVIIGKLSLGLSALGKIGGIAGVITKVTAVFVKLGAVFTTISGFLTSTLIPAVMGLGAPLFLIVGAITAVIAIGVALYKNWDVIAEKAGQLKDWIVKKWTESWENTKETFGKMKEIIGNAMSGMKKEVDENGGGISGALKTYGDRYKEIWGSVFEKLDKITGGKLSKIKENVSESLKETVRTMSGNWSKAYEDTKEKWKEIIGTIINSVKSLPKTMFNYGKDVVTGFINGIASMFNKIREQAKKIVDSLTLPVRRALGINSPSKLFQEYGDNVGEGFVIGINETMSSIKQAGQDMARSIDFGLIQAVSNAGIGKASNIRPNEKKQNNTTNNSSAINLNISIGSFIGSRAELKNLERKLSEVRVLENRRLGFNL